MDEKWKAMHDELMGLTMKQLRGIARAEGITLGYDGATKRGTVNAIVGQRKHRELSGERGQ